MNIVTGKQPILSRTCRPFDFANPELDLAAFVREMGETMLKHKGIGLAAPQVGVDLRIFVMKTADGVMSCINPVILDSKGTATASEECLSFPGLRVPVARPKLVRVSFQGVDGKPFTLDFGGLWARVYQHELDHLNGRTIAGRAPNPMAEALARKRAQRVHHPSH